MTPVHCVLFDLDDVLVDYDRMAFAAGLGAATALDGRQVHARWWQAGLDARVDRGELPPAAHLPALSAALGCRVDADAWVAARAAATRPRPPVLALAEALAERGVALAVLTNNSLLLQQRIADICPAVAARFGAAVFASAGLGAAKPAPAAFVRCLAQLGWNARDTLFVDDLAENVDGARAAGLRAHRFTSPGALREALAGG